jgi:[ribosomal protein S5]-alanine N-acetyltransferase
MNITKPFETKRMKFRILADCDLDVIYRQFSDPDMCKYFSEPPCTKDEAQEIIEHYKNPIDKGYLRYGMFDKDNDTFIGTCGYHYLDNQLKQVEIGYDVWKEFWGQGYISEALPALINICFSHLNIDCVYILTHPENNASKASVKKFGFYECEPCRTIDVEPEICMKLMRSDWFNLTL